MLLTLLPWITGILILKYVHRFIKARKCPKPVMANLHREVRDLMQATQEIKENWSEMVSMMDQVRESQSNFVTNFRTLKTNLGRNGGGDHLVKCREEEKVYVDTVDSLVAKLATMREVARKQAEALVDEWGQDSNAKKTTSEESVRDAIAIVKRVLKDFLKENRKNINSEKENMKKTVRGLTDDLIKDSITFFSSDQQNSTVAKKDGVLELCAKLLVVDKSLKKVVIDVSSTKGVLDTIDGRLDEIYGKLEVDKKAMGKQFREASSGMAVLVDELDRQADVLDQTGTALAKVMAEMPREVQKKMMEEVSELLLRFAARVEVPMKKVVCNMRFLYEFTVSPKGSRKSFERGDVPDEDEDDEGMENQGVVKIREDVRGWMKDFRMKSFKTPKGVVRKVLEMDSPSPYRRQVQQVKRQMYR